MQLEPLHLQGRTIKSWSGYDKPADDKGRKGGRRRACSFPLHQPALKPGWVCLVCPWRRSLFGHFYPLPKKLLPVRRDWLKIYEFWTRLFAKGFGALLLLLF